MSLVTILRDTREQKGWEFDDMAADVEDETLTTGDYTVAELCDYDEENDTYDPNYAVERKSGQDFVQSVTSSRDRFKKEIKRASDWDSELMVLIEEPKRFFKRQQGWMKYRDVVPNQLFGTVTEWEKYYNVDFRFVGSRKRGQQIAFDTLYSRIRAELFE